MWPVAADNSIVLVPTSPALWRDRFFLLTLLYGSPLKLKYKRKLSFLHQTFSVDISPVSNVCRVDMSRTVTFRRNCIWEGSKSEAVTGVCFYMSRLSLDRLGKRTYLKI